MVKKKGKVMWRQLKELPDVLLALDWTENYPGWEKISLIAVDDEDYIVQVWDDHKDYMRFLLLDPHDTWVEDFSETED